MFATAACGMAVLSACGGAATSSTGSANAAAAVRLAAQQMEGRSFRLAMTGTTAIDTSNVSGAGQGFSQGLSQGAGTTSIEEDVQDGSHVSATMTVAGHKLAMVIYGGTVYVSPDGTTYESAPFLSSLVGQFSTSQFQDYAQHLSNTQDVGPSTQDGVATEEYRATVDPGYISSLIQKVAGSMTSAFGASSQSLSSVLSAFTFQNIDLDWYVDSGGRLVRQTTHTAMKIDMGALAANAGSAYGSQVSGTATLTQDMDAHFSDWGADIKVAQPVSTGTLNPQDFGQLLQHAPPASQ